MKPEHAIIVIAGLALLGLGLYWLATGHTRRGLQDIATGVADILV